MRKTIKEKLVEHMIEFKRNFLLVVGKGNTFLVF
jgi:hypothetical protein